MSNHGPRSTFPPAAASATAPRGFSSRPTRAVVLASCFLAIWSAFPGALSGQEPSLEGVSLSVGMGPTTGGMAWQIAASRHLSSTKEMGLRLLGSFDALGNESAHDMGMHFGVRTAAKGVWLGTAAGPSLTWTSDRECVEFLGFYFRCRRRGRDDGTHRTWGAGASGQATLGWRRVSFAVVGGVNTTASYAGVLVRYTWTGRAGPLMSNNVQPSIQRNLTPGSGS